MNSLSRSERSGARAHCRFWIAMSAVALVMPVAFAGAPPPGAPTLSGAIGAGPNFPQNTFETPIIVNLRVQGVLSGAGPINVQPGQFLVNGETDNLLEATAYVPVGANNTVCIAMRNLDSSAQSTDTIELQVTATNAQNQSVTQTVPLSVKDGPYVDVQIPADVAACVDPVAANLPPVAAAGADQSVADTNGQPGEAITLDGTGSTDSDGTIVSYVWTDAAGKQVATGANPTGVVLPDGVNTITLTVTDNGQLSSSKTVTITIGAPRTPVANAGPDQTIADTDKQDGELVQLNGSASADPDGTIVEYRWRVGTTTLATGARPEVIRLPDGQNVVTLTVTDNAGLTATDTVTININAAPKATVLADLPGLNPNQKAMAEGLDGVCGRALNAQTPTTPDDKARSNARSKVRAHATEQDRADLALKCQGLLFNNSADNQIEALDELSGKDFSAARTQTLFFANTQYLGIMDRLMALRGGARGLSLAGLNLEVQGSHVPLVQLERMAKQMFGGAASADKDKEPGGLLSDKWGLWARGNYSFGKKDQTAASPKFEADQWGLLGGIDYRFTDTMVFGGAVSYGDSNVKFQPSGEGKLGTTTWGLSAYGSMYAAKNFYFDALANVGNSSYNADRNISYSDGMGLVQADAKGDTKGMTYSAALSAGYDFLIGGLTLSPNIGGYYIDTTIDDFVESGAGGLNLAYDKQNYQSFTGNIGVRATLAWNLPWGVLLPHLRTDYIHEFHNDVEVFGVHFDADPDATSPPILIKTDNPDQSYWRLAAGFAAQFKHGISGYIDYQRLEGYESITFQDVSVGLRFQESF